MRPYRSLTLGCDRTPESTPLRGTCTMLGRYRSQWWQLKRYVQNISLRIERTRSKLMPEIAIGVKEATFELRCVVYLRLARNDRYSRSIVCLGDSHNGGQTEVLR